MNDRVISATIEMIDSLEREDLIYIYGYITGKLGDE